MTIYRIRDPMKPMAAIVRLCAESELVIGHYFMHPLQIAAEQAGLPYVSVLLSHAAIPSDYSHPLYIPGMGRIGNRFLWWLTRSFINRGLKVGVALSGADCGQPADLCAPA